jgi:hypothetical protein
MGIEITLFIIVASLLFFMIINPKIKYAFWIVGMFYWSNYSFFIFTYGNKPSIDRAFLIIGMSIFLIPLFFVVSGIQTIIIGFSQRNYIKILTSLGILLFTLLYYKDITIDVSFDWVKMILRSSIIITSAVLLFQKEESTRNKRVLKQKIK